MKTIKAGTVFRYGDVRIRLLEDIGVYIAKPVDITANGPVIQNKEISYNYTIMLTLFDLYKLTTLSNEEREECIKKSGLDPTSFQKLTDNLFEETTDEASISHTTERTTNKTMSSAR